MSHILYRLTILACLILLPAFSQAQNPTIPNLPNQDWDPNYISHGPMLGGLTDSAIKVWARTGRPGSFQVAYGTTPDTLDQLSADAVTVLDHDNTAAVTLPNLKPNTKYYYELIVPLDETPNNGRTGKRGSFRTLPNAATARDPKLNPEGLFNFSFEFGCGNNQVPYRGHGPLNLGFKTMLPLLQDDIHFAIQNGDWLYETQRHYTPQQWLGQVFAQPGDMPDVLKKAPTLAGVWQNYKYFMNQSPNLVNWHRHIPTFFMYDDHEMLNDIWGAGSPGLQDRRAVFRDIGARGWYDYLAWSNPVKNPSPVRFGHAKLTAGSDILVDDEADFSSMDLNKHTNLHVHWGTDWAGINVNSLDDLPPDDPNAMVYEIVEIIDGNRLRIKPTPKHDTTSAYSVGRKSYYKLSVSNCDIFVTDTRGQREMHDTSEPDKPGLSMLGKVQYKWLTEGVAASKADFIFIVSPVNLMIPHVGGGTVRGSNKDDAWTVFYDEREQLIDFCDAIDKPVFFLSGDLHNSFAGEITDNVWEFASAPHNSGNHYHTDEGDRPPNGKFKYGPREVDIHWSTYFMPDIPRNNLRQSTFAVIQVNNVFNNSQTFGQARQPDGERWVAYPIPQVVFKYYDGLTGRIRYAHSFRAHR
jgi:phosphodiesterase/alkaline phosphatase D-like protein